MRIIGGLYRGKKLLSPRSQNIRPTSDQAREAVFNILYTKLDAPVWSELSLADIFSGSGAFALESVSRGIKKVIMVDIDLTDAKRNIALFPTEKNKIECLRADATHLPQAKEGFDIIFLDAPYNKELSEKALTSLSQKGWITPHSMIIVELAREEKLILPESLQKTDERVYGITRFIFIRPQTK